MIKNIITASLIMASPFQFPETKDYVSNRDIGYKQYETKSIHQTNTYSLTFDDGPHELYTPLILDILKKYQVKATFFIVTSRLNEKTFPIFKRILDEGHIAASHHHKHFNSNLQDKNSFSKMLKDSIRILNNFHKKAGYDYTEFYYRFPYAAYGKNEKYHHLNTIREVSYELFEDNCINFVFWDIDSGDWIPKMESKEIFQNLKSYQEAGKFITYKIIKTNGIKKIIKKEVYNSYPTKGGVILFHDIQKRTIKALKLFLNYAHKNELKFNLLNQIEEFKYDKKCNLKGENK